jgi:hypothetical protein
MLSVEEVRETFLLQLLSQYFGVMCSEPCHHLYPFVSSHSAYQCARTRWKAGSMALADCISSTTCRKGEPGGRGLGTGKSYQLGTSWELLSYQQKMLHPLCSPENLLGEALRMLKSCFDKTNVLFYPHRILVKNTGICTGPRTKNKAHILPSGRAGSSGHHRRNLRQATAGTNHVSG